MQLSTTEMGLLLLLSAAVGAAICGATLVLAGSPPAERDTSRRRWLLGRRQSSSDEPEAEDAPPAEQPRRQLAPVWLAEECDPGAGAAPTFATPLEQAPAQLGEPSAAGGGKSATGAGSVESSGLRPETPAAGSPAALPSPWTSTNAAANPYDTASRAAAAAAAAARVGARAERAAERAAERGAARRSGDDSSSNSKDDEAAELCLRHMRVGVGLVPLASIRSSADGGSGTNTNTNTNTSSGNSSDHALTTDLALMPDVFNSVSFSELELIRLLGEGSFGQVWLARWHQTFVAVKILMLNGRSENAQSSQLRNMIREASIMHRLRHPNICMYLGASLDPPSIIMEYCSHKSLDALLASAAHDPRLAKQLPWGRLLSMACDAAKGMLYLHTCHPPVCHRDLKSANLLIDGQWHAKVADFNLSRPMEAGVAVSTLCVTNPRWLAPCILSGEPGGLAADVWAFGTVLWEIMTWSVPFENLNPFQIINLVQTTGSSCLAAPPPEELPAGPFAGYQEYVALMQACWARNPDDRPSMEEVATKVHAMLVSELRQHSTSRSSVERQVGSPPVAGGAPPLPGCTESPMAAPGPSAAPQSPFALPTPP